MRKFLLFAIAMLMVVPAFAQKMSKEEKAKAAQLAFDGAVESIDAKTWVIVPESYTNSDGMFENNIEDTNFLSAEGTNMFSQGYIVCDNGKTNVSDISEYEVTYDKKGNLTLRIVVHGNYWKGTYKITMKKAGGNMVDVIFNPQNGTTRKFTGPLVPLAGAKYTKRANPL